MGLRDAKTLLTVLAERFSPDAVTHPHALKLSADGALVVVVSFDTQVHALRLEEKDLEREPTELAEDVVAAAMGLGTMLGDADA